MSPSEHPLQTPRGPSNLVSEIGNQARGVLLLVILALVPCLPALYFAGRDALKFQSTPYVEELEETAEQVLTLPEFEELKNPLAILLLDVSWSMTQSDSPHYQTVAAEIFSRAYQKISLGAGRQRSRPRLSVVLYSTVASILTVEGRPWFEIAEKRSVEEVVSVTKRFLGQEGEEDPRAGQRTDHMVAAESARRIIDRYRREYPDASVCTILMTDGVPDPYVVVDASLTEEQREANFQELKELIEATVSSPERRERILREIQSLRDSPVREVPVTVSPTDLYPVKRLHAGLGNDLRIQFLRRVQAMEEARQTRRLDPDALQARLSPRDQDIFRIVRLNPQGEIRDPRIVDAATSTLLPHKFAEALTAWSGLQEQAIANRKLTVPIGARSLVVIDASANGGAKVVCGASSYPIEGGLASALDPTPGPCELHGTSRSVQAFADRRYGWSFYGLPQAYSALSSGRTAALGFFSLESGERTDLDRFYSNVSETLEVSVTFADGSSTSAQAGFDGSSQAHLFELPLPGRPAAGPVELQAQLESLVSTDGVECREVVRGQTEYAPSVLVRLEAETRSGKSRPVAEIVDLRVPRGGQIR